MKISLFLVGIILLIGVEVARVYYIMPFPGSQVDEVIEFAYFIQNYIWLFRIAGILMIGYPAFFYLVGDNASIKWTVAFILAFWLIVCYAFNFQFLADKMFFQPESVLLLNKKDSKINDNQLVIGVVLKGKSRAYPIEIIGYHHQVRDIIGGQQVMITYCTVCRSGRVFSPLVNGQPEIFRLVGMDHFNAMFEDASTKSWWRQINGTAIVGPLKGTQLAEIASQQMTLRAWLLRHPESLVLQADPKFKDQYETLAKYDEGKMEGSLEGRDSLSWKDKSWVVGVPMGLFAKAYDWNELVERRVINDRISGRPVVVAVEADSASFHTWLSVVGA
ncbi:MAG: DUF3179 domain-containing (seleno)protein, partial [Cyclobacteriaceae bacterium]|nr:DUF3179 domain-containing (seleno)protein [Cyclobacteriaceae bacterium]